MGLGAAKDEVLRKIGRYMLLFQQVERMLKFIITNGTLSGHVSELLKKREQQAKSVHKQTMGQLVGQFLETPTLGKKDLLKSSTD